MVQVVDNEVLRILYGGVTTIPEFNYETLSAPPLSQILWHPNDIGDLRSIATSIRYSGNINKKYILIDEIMERRAMKRLAAGTNRVVYRHLELPSIVTKVAIDSEGIKNNPDEFRCQHYIKPFCTKVFETSRCGTVGTFERVERITSRYEFASIADDIYDLITNALIGKYVLEDIGTNFMYNYGIRPGFGPVILDFPYVYELDGAKLYCDQVLDDGTICGGEIDYDDGFNFLTCSKCGRLFRASDLSKSRKESGIFVQANKKGALDMIVEICRGNEVIRKKEFKDTTQFMKTKKDLTKPKRKREKNSLPIAIGTYGRKSYKEALNEYNEKMGYAAEYVEEEESGRVGIYAREYVVEGSQSVDDAIRYGGLPSGVVVETSTDIQVERCYGDTPVVEEETITPETDDTDIIVSEEEEAESTGDVVIESPVEEDIVPNTDGPIVDDSRLLLFDNMAIVDEVADATLISDNDEAESETSEPSVPEPDPEIPKLVSAIDFGDDDTDDPSLQESTISKTIIVKPNPSRQRSRKYDSEFYNTRGK